MSKRTNICVRNEINCPEIATVLKREIIFRICSRRSHAVCVVFTQLMPKSHKHSGENLNYILLL